MSVASHPRLVAGFAAVVIQLAAHAAGDAAEGKKLYEQRCSGCHAVDANRVGPAHRGVFGRKAGLAPGFGYSAALQGSGVVWDEKSLDQWLTDPEGVIPGQQMFFQVDDPIERQKIIAFLATLKP